MAAPSMQEIAPSKLTSELLYENGVADRKAGKSMHDGWREIATALGFSTGRTPAREKYEDGYYGA